jgi:neutral ceramidase
VTFTLEPEEKPLRFGPVDSGVFTMRMEDSNGAVIGSVVGFGCHPVCIYPHLSTTVSADYPAFATRVVEQVEGGISLFLLGLAGNTVPLQRGVRPCEQIGTALGGEALCRLSLTATSDKVALKALAKEVVFPAKGTSDPITTEIQALKLGDVYILGLPGEVLVEVGLEIKRRTNLQKLFIVTLANDAVGYVCHSRAYDEGGYEPGSGTRLAKGAGEIMVEQALALLAEAKTSE